MLWTQNCWEATQQTAERTTWFALLRRKMVLQSYPFWEEEKRNSTQPHQANGLQRCCEGFDLKKALSLFNQTLPHYSDLSVVMTLKRLYKKLGRNKDVKRMIKIEAETLKRTGEFNLNYLRNYIKNFKNFYPIPF